MTRPAMKDLTPAYARIARIDAQQSALFDRREAEFQRIRKEGARVAKIAIRRAGLVRGETIISTARWALGIYDGTELNWPPMAPSQEWSFRIHYRAIGLRGTACKKLDSHTVFVTHPGDVCGGLRIVGRMVNGKAVYDAKGEV